MHEHKDNAPESQLVPLTGTDAREIIREKVLRAVYEALPQYSGRRHIPFLVADKWYLEDCSKVTDAAIAAHLEALGQMELPEEVACQVGYQEALAMANTKTPELPSIILRREFRAICAALRSPKTGEK